MEGTVVERPFEQPFSITSRIAAAQVNRIVRLYRLPWQEGQDLQQEVLLELWRKSSAFDARRASWRTFAERLTANRLISILRQGHASRAGHGKECSPEGLLLAAPGRHEYVHLKHDVRRVLGGVSPSDRELALSLAHYSVSETGHRLCVSRSAIYRAIGRLRCAFSAAGFSTSAVDR